MPATRILLAWEHGAGLGHVMRLLPLARRLLERGHDVSLAACDLAAVRDALALEPAPGLRLLAAPALPAPQGEVHALGDTLRRVFGPPANQTVLAAAWTTLLDLLRPEIVVADHAPLLTALCLGRLPVQVIGDPPMVPPDQAPLPPFRPGAETPPASLAAEQAVLAEVNDLRDAAGLAPLPRLAATLRGDGRPWIGAHPAFDPYAALRADPLDPAPEVAIALPPPPAQRPPIALIYAPKPHPVLVPLVQAVVAQGLRPRLVLRESLPALRQALLAAGTELLEQPRPRDVLLAEARLVVHAGGMGTAMACLGTATPQIVIAAEYAGMVILTGLRGLGAGLGGPLGPQPLDAATLGGAIAAAQAPALARCLAGLATQLRQAAGPDPLGLLVARIEGLRPAASPR